MGGGSRSMGGALLSRPGCRSSALLRTWVDETAGRDWDTSSLVKETEGHHLTVMVSFWWSLQGLRTAVIGLNHQI